MDIFHSDSWKKCVWIELTGFDREKPDFGVEDFLSRTGFVPDVISFLLTWMGFVFSHDGLNTEKRLSITEASYAAHPFAPERPRQEWTNLEFRRLIDLLHERGIRVYMSYFNYDSYTDDDGKRVVHPDLESCAEELRDSDRRGAKGYGLGMLKRMPDGRFFEDILIDKTVRAMNDYGFDGIQIADGLSSPRVSLEQGDYSEDMLGQFADMTGIAVPEGVADKAAWIWENRRLEWIRFHAARWEIFFRKFMDKLHASGKDAVFNSAWTRDPFEAMYRFGVDYRKVRETGVSGCMVEDTSPGLAILSRQDNAYLMTDEQRKKVHYEFLSVLMMNRAAMPRLAITPLSGIHDTMEQWGVLEHAPTALTRNVMNNLCTFLRDGNGMRPVTDGPWFCLSDGLSANDWTFIRRQWEIGAIKDPVAPCGATVIWSDRRVDAELEAFTARRTTPTHRWISELLYHGAPLYSIARTEDIDSLRGAILVTNPALLPDDEREKIASYRGGEVFLVGEGAEDNALIREKNSFAPVAFGVKGETGAAQEIENSAPYDFDPVKGLEMCHSIWTHPLAFAPVSDEFLQKAADVIRDRTGAPRVALEYRNELGRVIRPCKCILTATGEKTARVLLTNDDYFYNIPEVELGRRIRSITCLTKYPGYRVPHEGSRFTLRVACRGAEALDITFE